MTELDRILEQALALPATDRQFLVSALTQSLPSSETDGDDHGEDVYSGADFLAELRLRSSSRDGTLSGPAATLIAEIRQQQAGARQL
ncbi:MAG: hypothetical protein AB7U73_25795 [Pirellulales bacterium]